MGFVCFVLFDLLVFFWLNVKQIERCTHSVIIYVSCLQFHPVSLVPIEFSGIGPQMYMGKGLQLNSWDMVKDYIRGICYIWAICLSLYGFCKSNMNLDFWKHHTKMYLFGLGLEDASLCPHRIITSTLYLWAVSHPDLHVWSIYGKAENHICHPEFTQYKCLISEQNQEQTMQAYN